jgi:predicted helicase
MKTTTAPIHPTEQVMWVVYVNLRRVDVIIMAGSYISARHFGRPKANSDRITIVDPDVEAQLNDGL